MWDQVRDGLLQIAKKTHTESIPEDVYLALKNGLVSLHLFLDDGKYLGFCVLEPVKVFATLKLNVWFLYSVSPQNNPIELFHEEVAAVAKQIGAKKIFFLSSRAYGDRLEKYGYFAKQVVFEKEL